MSSSPKTDPQLEAFEKFRKDAALPPTVNVYTAMKAAWFEALRWVGARGEQAPPDSSPPYCDN